MDYPKQQIVQANAQKLPFENDFFDVIIAVQRIQKNIKRMQQDIKKRRNIVFGFTNKII